MPNDRERMLDETSFVKTFYGEDIWIAIYCAPNKKISFQRGRKKLTILKESIPWRVNVNDPEFYNALYSPENRAAALA